MKHNASNFGRKIFSTVLFFCLLLTFTANAAKTINWVGTWSTAPQLVEPNNMPPSPGLTNNAIRQIVRISIGGERIRLKFTNEHGDSPVSIKSAQIALSTGGAEINASSTKKLTFSGKEAIQIEAGKTVYSDPIVFHLDSRMDVAITLYFGQTSAKVTGHPGSRTTSYLVAGNDPSVSDFTKGVKTEHWYIINSIDVEAPQQAGAVAILGNSITDGRGSTTNLQNRWPDILSERLLTNPATKQVGVLNMGIGGNCMLAGGLGPTGKSRFERDILNQAGVKWVIIYLGVNDLGGVRNEASSLSTADKLIQSYKDMIAAAHAKNLKIYGATIMPFKGNGYYNTFSETARQKTNTWIRTSGAFDAVIDFDVVLQNPQDPAAMLSAFDFQNDFLHPSFEGHTLMGQFVPISLFVTK